MHNFYNFIFLFADDIASSIEDSKRKRAFSPTPLPIDPNMESASIITASASKNMLQKIQNISTLTKKTVPEFDDFAKRKKKDDGLFMQAMTKQSATMMSIATVLKESLEKSCSDKSDSTFTSASVNPILTAIGFALKSVPEEKQLECMLDLLQILKSKYVQQ